MIDLKKKFQEFPDTKIAFIDKVNKKSWDSWKRFDTCILDEYQEANLRELFNDEVVIDIDDENIEEYNKIINLLREKEYNFYSYKTGSRGYHISLFFNNIAPFTIEQRNKIRKLFIKKLKLDEKYQHKVSERTALAMEGRNHFKTGNKKELVEEVPGENVMDYDVIVDAIQKIDEEKEIKKTIATDNKFFINYHLNDPFFQHIKNNKIADSTERNNIVFKNVAIALVKEGLNEEQIKEIMEPIIKNNFPGKNYAEFNGWVKKAMNKDITEYNMYETNNWAKTYYNIEVYDMKDTILESKKEDKVLKEESKDELKIYWNDDINNVNIKDIEWVVESWIPKGDICFIAGKASSYKTTVAMHMALCIANNKLVFNKYKVMPVKVLYVNEENHINLFKQFFNRVLKGLTIDKIDNFGASIMENLRLDTMKRKIDEKTDIEKLADFINKNNIELVIFDSFRRFIGFDENDATRMNDFFDRMKRLRSKCNNLTIIILHHMKKNNKDQDSRDMLRGSSDIVNSADSIIEINRKTGQACFTISHIKNRSGQEMNKKLIFVGDSNDKESAYMYESDKNLESNESIQSLPEKCANAIVKLLEEKKVGVFSRNDLADFSKDYSFDTVTKALRILKEEGTIVGEGAGKYTKYIFNNVKDLREKEEEEENLDKQLNLDD